MNLTTWLKTAVLLTVVLMVASFATITATAAEKPGQPGSAEPAVGSVPHLRALKSARTTLRQVWELTPLSVIKTVIVKEKGKGYGLYEARSGNEYTPGEPIYIYMEPVGYTVKKRGSKYAVSISADMAVLDEKGNILAGKKRFADWSFESHNFSTEMYMNVTYTLDGLRPGKYVLETTLHDEPAGSVTMVRTPIVIKSSKKKKSKAATDAENAASGEQ